MRGLVRVALVAGVAMVIAAATAMVGSARVDAIPVRGDTGWSVLLCKFSDHAEEPHDARFFENFLTSAGAGTGGLGDYYADQSYGLVKLTGSVVRGWYTMAYTLAQESPKSRDQKIQDCVTTAARHGYTVPAGHRTIVIVNAQIDAGAAGLRVLLDPGAWTVNFAAHEMGHGYGLNHSYSNDLTYRNASWSQPGEYDDEWDQMSALHIHGWETSRYGAGPVGFNAYHRDKLGWLPHNRVLTFGADRASSATVALAPLDAPPAATTGPILVRVPFDPGDLFHYYTVEFRRKTGWDRGIPADTVLIHEIKNGTATLLRDLAPAAGRAPLQTLAANGVTIAVGAVGRVSASVSITSDIATRCVAGYVWREARPGDLVCVTPAVRSATAADNGAAAARRAGGGPFGPDTCVSGYVWRDAFPGDHVCVTPATRTEAAADNAAATDRSDPARFVYGPNACASGYVWREIDQNDYVCVTPAVRSAAAYDNGQAAVRRVGTGPFGPDTCVSGYVWREAYPNDHVCVLPATRTQAGSDNSQAAGRVARPNGG